MKYRQEIDGLRAVAVIPVILFHAGLETFSGGFVGVDIFFVISGYLITSIIFTELNESKFSLLRFYERRARRILPALFLVLICTYIAAWQVLYPSDFNDLAKSLISTTFFLANIYFWRDNDYFSGEADLQPLLHMWSLAVEEQFYLFFPIFLILAFRCRKNWVIPSIFLIGLSSLVLAQYSSEHYPRSNFFLLPTRIWEFAIGAIIGIHLKPDAKASGKPYSSEILSLVGLSLIAISIFFFTSSTPFPSIYALLPTLGTGLIIMFASQSTLVGKLLSAKILVGLGLVSYSAYLWHQPVFALVRYQTSKEFSTSVLILLCVLVFFLAYLTLKFVEKPTRNRNKTTNKAILLITTTGIVGFSAISILTYMYEGVPIRSVYKNLFIAEYQPDNRILSGKNWQILRERTGENTYGVENNPFDRTLWFSATDQREKLLIVGNSHSNDIYNVLTHSESATNKFQLARFGTQFKYLVRDDADLWSSPNYRAAETIMIATRYSRGDAKRIEPILSKLLSDGKKVAIVKNIHLFPKIHGRTIADLLLQRRLIKKIRTEEITISDAAKKINQAYFLDYKADERLDHLRETDLAIQKFKESHPEVTVLDRMDYICDISKRECSGINSKLEKYFFDAAHHSITGAIAFGKRVDDSMWLQPLLP